MDLVVYSPVPTSLVTLVEMITVTEVSDWWFKRILYSLYLLYPRNWKGHTNASSRFMDGWLNVVLLGIASHSAGAPVYQSMSCGMWNIDGDVCQCCSGFSTVHGCWNPSGTPQIPHVWFGKCCSPNEMDMFVVCPFRDNTRNTLLRYRLLLGSHFCCLTLQTSILFGLNFILLAKYPQVDHELRLIEHDESMLNRPRAVVETCLNPEIRAWFMHVYDQF